MWQDGVGENNYLPLRVCGHGFGKVEQFDFAVTFPLFAFFLWRVAFGRVFGGDGGGG